MGESMFKHHTYGEAVKQWNNDVFGKSVFAFPRKGYSAYNQVQDIRAGKSIDKPKSIADLKKVEEPKKVEPKKAEPKAEPKKTEPKKTKAEKEAEAKAKAEKKEMNVKSVISNLMQDEKKAEPKEENKYSFKMPSFTKEQNERMEQIAKEKQEEENTDKQKIMKEHGKNGENIPSEKLFYKMASNGVLDALDMKRKAEELTGFTWKELKYTFPGFYSKYDDYLKNDYPIMLKKEAEPKKEAEKEQLIAGGARKSEKYEKEQEQRYVNDVSKQINNFDSYWRDSWKTLSAQERLNAYNDIANIIDLQYAKTGTAYNTLKEKIDKFTIPDYAKKGYELWKNKGKMLRVKELKGRVPNTAYDKQQMKGLKEKEDLMKNEPKNEVVEKNISRDQKSKMSAEQKVEPKKQKLQLGRAIGFEVRAQDAEEFYFSEKEKEEIAKLREEYKKIDANDYDKSQVVMEKVNKMQNKLIENIQNKLGALTFNQFEKLISYKKQLSQLKKPISGSTAMYYKKEMSLRNKIKEIEDKLL